jgi:hypothetical protein
MPSLGGWGVCRVGPSAGRDRLPLAFRVGRVRRVYAVGVSAERDELRRLIEQLPDDRVQAVLAEARRQSGSAAVGEWPPPWFGSFASGRSDLGSEHDDLLAEGFGPRIC